MIILALAALVLSAGTAAADDQYRRGSVYRGGSTAPPSDARRSTHDHEDGDDGYAPADTLTDEDRGLRGPDEEGWR